MRIALALALVGVASSGAAHAQAWPARPVKSMPSVLTDLLGGRLDFAFADLTSVHGHLQSGELKPIAFTLDQRASQLPNVPTVSETQEFAGFEVISWIGLVGPAGMPRDVVERLNANVNKIPPRSDIRARLTELGSEAAPSSPDELGKFIVLQLDSWRAKISAAAIQPE
jgi:tripartite-type tricarboxylate transporter receptor subunit TctC